MFLNIIASFNPFHAMNDTYRFETGHFGPECLRCMTASRC